MLSLSRNLGLITRASVMGAVFALASATSNIMTVHPEAVATGMRFTFAVGAILIVIALAIGLVIRVTAAHRWDSDHVSWPNRCAEAMCSDDCGGKTST